MNEDASSDSSFNLLVKGSIEQIRYRSDRCRKFRCVWAHYDSFRPSFGNQVYFAQ